MQDARHRLLAFPDAVSDALAQFAECASPFGIFDEALLGGGTVLAARWQHRLSTDLDFFLRQGPFDDLIARREGELRDALGGVAFGMIVTPRHMQCVMRKTAVEVSVDVVSSSALGPAAPDAAPHGVATQTTSAILAGKVVGRMMQQGRATVRDVYDLCVAERADPDALLAAVAAVPAGAMLRTVALLEQELAGNQRLKPLIAPAHIDIADDLVGHGTELLLRLGRQLEAMHGRQRD